MSNPLKTTDSSNVSYFDPELVSDLINKVKGHSSLAILSGQTPIPFNGMKEFTFNFDGDIDVVAEGGAKKHGGISIDPVTIVPIKVEYGARVTDEFMYMAEEEALEILKNFNEGFAKKVAAGLDKMAMHGINPSTGSASAVIGTNHFDSKVTQTVQYNGSTPDANIEAAIALVEGSDGDVTGLAISPAMRSAIAAMRDGNNNAKFPEFAFGGKPANLGPQRLDINKTVSVGAVDEAIIGDFANMFKWGFAKQVPTKIIEYGDPDNTGRDLAGHNEVYIRAEMYLGWGILDAGSFARVID